MWKVPTEVVALHLPEHTEFLVRGILSRYRNLERAGEVLVVTVCMPFIRSHADDAGPCAESILQSRYNRSPLLIDVR